jgi:26S proteasome regulatory subunit T1
MDAQGVGPYTKDIKKAEDDIKAATKKVKELAGIKESDTGLGPPSLWDLAADKQMMQEEQALQVARCTKIINPGTEDAKYVINIKQVRSQLPSPAQPSASRTGRR